MATLTSRGIARSTARRARSHTIIAVYDLAFGWVGLATIWLALPARWWPVDAFGTALCVTLIAVGISLLLRLRHSARAALAAAALTLATGAALVVTILVRAKELTDHYGEAGLGGAAMLIVALSLLVPYLVVLPAGQLVFLLRSDEERF
jgi:hypothetical protein